ncbi:MAG: ABC transporter transmembrane domain-containing protein, partial [Rhodospirillaceae bacterium]|nr:ABC transporter transmembrane domain-containing protein [Rhodospirillaceae bacterium]
MAINAPDPNPDARTADPRDSFAVYQGRLAASDQRHSADTRILWRIIRLALRYRLRVAVAIAATIVAAVFQLAIPPLLGNAVDSALGLLRGGASEADAARDALTYAALLLLGASVLRGAFTLIHNYNGEAIGHLLSYDLRLAFYNKLQTLSFSFHDQVHTGELITRGMLDVEGVRMFINTGLLRLILLTVLIGIGAYLLLSTDLLLGLLSLSFVPFVAWQSSVARLKLRTMWLTLQERMAALGQIMDENLTGIRVVRAFGAEPYEIEKYDVASEEAMTVARKRIKTRVASTTVMTFAYFVAMGLV